MFKNKRKSIKQLGFSLVEMSVVLAAVAAVVVVTAGGSSVLQRSKITSVVRDINGFTKAVGKFEDKYKGIPGDLATVTTLTGATAGNGNGSIDTTSEALQFWKHLALAGLIKGNFNGTSTYIPGTGVPAGPISSSGYNVINPTSISLPSQSIVIEFAGFTSSTNSQAILTPEDAKAIDDKLDDGNPNTGTVIATDLAGNNSTTNCATTNTSAGRYNLTNKTLGCRMRFILRKSGQANDTTTLSGTCTTAGLTRRSDSTSDVCPTGTIGKIMKTCQFDSSNSGTWVKSESHCTPVTCLGGGKYNDTRVVQCMSGYTGSGIVQTCSAEGVWVTTSTSCSYATTNTVSCGSGIADGTIMKPNACNWGQAGSVNGVCGTGGTSGLWQTTNSCSAITCSSPSGTVGSVDPTNYNCSSVNSNYSGTYHKTCAMDGNWKVTSNSCVPLLYSANCSTGATVDLGCAPGETGVNIQTCIATNTWSTTKDTCTPITCSGERVGSARVVKDASCPSGAGGVVIEVCESDGGTPPQGKWTANYNHCAASMCPSSTDAKGDRSGNAVWQYTAAGSSNVSGTCVSGYTGSPTRSCSSSGSWGAVSNACTRATCAANTHDNAVWPSTPSLTTNVKATNCLLPSYQGSPVADCDATGNWLTTKTPCKATDIPVISGLSLWLDASDYLTLYSDSSCTLGAVANGNVGCWKDKSGNGMNATQNNTNLQPKYIEEGQNNKSVLYLDQVDDLLLTPLNINSEYSIFAVYNYTNGNNNKYNAAVQGSSNWWMGRISNLACVFAAGYRSSFTMQQGQLIIVDVVDDLSSGADGKTLINATRSSSGYANVTMPLPGNISVGLQRSSYVGQIDNMTTSLGGNVAEVIAFNRTVSTFERQLIEIYLSRKWGINLPASSDIKLWLDANDSTTLFTGNDCVTGARPSIGANIGCWKDKSGNNNNATAGNAPVLSLDMGLPALKFDGSSTYLNTNLAYLINTSFTVIIVDSRRSNTANWFLSTTQTSYTNNLTYGYGYNNGVSFGVAATPSSWTSGAGSIPGYDSNSPKTTVNMAIYSKDSAPNYSVDVQHFVNGAKTSNKWTNTGLVPVAVANNAVIGKNVGYCTSSYTSCYYNGNIGEIIIYNRAISSDEITQVKSYLGRKWSVTLP